MKSCISVSRKWPLLPIFSDYSASVEVKPSSCHHLAQLQHVGLLKQRPFPKEEVSRSEVLTVGQDSMNLRAVFHPKTGYKGL